MKQVDQVKQVDEARPGAWRQRDGQQDAAVTSGQDHSTTQSNRVVVQRTYRPDLVRCAQALAGLLAGETGVDEARGSSPHPAEPEAGEGME